MANMHKVSSTWEEGMRFSAAIGGHTIIMDAPEHAGGTNLGSVPKPFLLAALSGCTGMDVISLLNKQRVPYTSFLVDVNGELTETAPMTYKTIEVVYTFEAPEGYQEKVIKDCIRSLEQLCGVAHILKQVLPITYKVIYNKSEIYNAIVPSLEVLI
jgi:putative redox protein